MSPFPRGLQRKHGTIKSAKHIVALESLQSECLQSLDITWFSIFNIQQAVESLEASIDDVISIYPIVTESRWGELTNPTSWDANPPNGIMVWMMTTSCFSLGFPQGLWIGSWPWLWNITKSSTNSVRNRKIPCVTSPIGCFFKKYDVCLSPKKRPKNGLNPEGPRPKNNLRLGPSIVRRPCRAFAPSTMMRWWMSCWSIPTIRCCQGF